MTPVKTKPIDVPVDALGASIDEEVIADVVGEALFDYCTVVRNHVHSAFNAYFSEPSYETATTLAAIALRFAQEHVAERKR